MTWISNNLGSLIVGAVVAVAIVRVIIKLINDRKKGKTCSCGCENCSMNNNCSKK